MAIARIAGSILMTLAFAGCALERLHARRNFHYAGYWLARPKAALECGAEGAMSFCRYRPQGLEEDPETTVYFLHYATGDARSLSRLGIANVFYRYYRKAGLRPPRLIAVSFGTHWLFSDRPGRRQIIDTGRFLSEDLPFLKKRFGDSPKQFVWGASQGGYNALQLLFARPGAWQAAAVSCPALYIEDPFAGRFQALAARTGAPKASLIDGMALFNTRLADAKTWREEEPIARARAATVLPPVLVQANRRDEYGFFEGAQALSEALAPHAAGSDFAPEPGGHCVFNAEKVAAFFAKIAQ